MAQFVVSGKVHEVNSGNNGLEGVKIYSKYSRDTVYTNSNGEFFLNIFDNSYKSVASLVFEKEGFLVDNPEALLENTGDAKLQIYMVDFVKRERWKNDTRELLWKMLENKLLDSLSTLDSLDKDFSKNTKSIYEQFWSRDSKLSPIVHEISRVNLDILPAAYKDFLDKISAMEMPDEQLVGILSISPSSYPNSSFLELYQLLITDIEEKVTFNREFDLFFPLRTAGMHPKHLGINQSGIGTYRKLYESVEDYQLNYKKYGYKKGKKILVQIQSYFNFLEGINPTLLVHEKAWFNMVCRPCLGLIERESAKQLMESYLSFLGELKIKRPIFYNFYSLIYPTFYPNAGQTHMYFIDPMHNQGLTAKELDTLSSFTNRYLEYFHIPIMDKDYYIKQGLLAYPEILKWVKEVEQEYPHRYSESVDSKYLRLVNAELQRKEEWDLSIEMYQILKNRYLRFHGLKPEDGHVMETDNYLAYALLKSGRREEGHAVYRNICRDVLNFKKKWDNDLSELQSKVRFLDQYLLSDLINRQNEFDLPLIQAVLELLKENGIQNEFIDFLIANKNKFLQISQLKKQVEKQEAREDKVKYLHAIKGIWTEIIGGNRIEELKKQQLLNLLEILKLEFPEEQIKLALALEKLLEQNTYVNFTNSLLKQEIARDVELLLKQNKKEVIKNFQVYALISQADFTIRNTIFELIQPILKENRDNDSLHQLLEYMK